MKMNKILAGISFLLMAGAGMPCCAQTQLTMRDAFLQMPDSLVPYLPHDKRLDLLDYLDANMKAEVTNELQGKTVLETLGTDSLVLHMNDSHQLSMYLFETDAPVDSSRQVVVMSHEYRLATGEYERTQHCFSARWTALKELPPLSASQLARLKKEESTLLRRDDEVLKREPFSHR